MELMIIGVDLRILTRDAHTGIEEYTKRLLSFLIPIDRSIKYKFFYNAYVRDELTHDWAFGENVSIVERGIPNKILETSSFLGFPRIDKLLGGVDVFFQPHFLPATVSRECKRIITFHDLSFERYPEFFSRRRTLWHKRVCPQKQARSADKIIAISESTKNDLIDLYKVDSENIKVIYSGVDHEYFAAGVNGEDISAVKNKYKLPESYVFFLGTIEPRKNVLGLIRAFESIKVREPDRLCDLKLVIAGSVGWLCKELFDHIHASKNRNDIIVLGQIEDSERRILYKLSKVFIFPSFFEGFGLPPLEAMACGTPVITSNISPLPDVVGASAVAVNPQRVDEMARAMKELLLKDELRNKMIEKGRERAQKFSWERCAEETLGYLTR